MPPPQGIPQAGSTAGNDQRIIDLQSPAALLTLYVGVRANQLGIAPDASLSDPRWTTLCTEAMQLVNSWMSWDATLAIAAWLAAGYGKSMTPQPAPPTPAPAPAPVVQPPAATTTPATPAHAPTAAQAIANPVAAAMTALGLRAAS